MGGGGGETPPSLLEYFARWSAWADKTKANPSFRKASTQPGRLELPHATSEGNQAIIAKSQEKGVVGRKSERLRRFVHTHLGTKDINRSTNASARSARARTLASSFARTAPTSTSSSCKAVVTNILRKTPTSPTTPPLPRPAAKPCKWTAVETPSQHSAGGPLHASRD